MPETFTQWLILVLIGLLFGKEYILTPILNKWGFKVKNGNGTEHRIKDLEGHAKVANKEMNGVNERLTSIETKLDIVMRYLKI